MSIRLVAALAATAALAACAPVMSGAGGSGGGYPPAGQPYPAAFDPAAFGWSAAAGQAGIDGRVNYAREGVAFACTGSVALTPDTPYTRNRFQQLYGSTELAAVPEAVIRARNVQDPAADYRSFVRSSTCDGNRFVFSGLPAGSWFLVTPVSAPTGGERIVLMRRVETRGDRATSVVQ